jgi:GNAT superfamily N-acetyltransferase
MMDDFRILPADKQHFHFLEKHDNHICRDMLKRKIEDSEVLIIELNGTCIGWLRYGLFWDGIPFMNMLFVLNGYRGKGYGRLLVGFWEKWLQEKGYKRFLTSTLANEDAQHFYRKLGYTDIGGFILPSEPLEIILMKDMPDEAV